MYGYWRRPSNEPTAFGQSMQQQALYDPKTTAVIRTGVEEAFRGVGSGYADYQAIRIKNAESEGEKLTQEQFDTDLELKNSGVQWYEGMTRASAMISKEFNDSVTARNRIWQDASTGQSVLGMTAAFGAGIIEPKNLAVGVGVSLAAPLVGTAGWFGNNVRKAYNLRKTALRARMAVGAVEGVAAGALIEPTNRYSAKTLQQDYTMADSVFNIATSAAFGAAMPAVGEGVTFAKNKLDKFRGRATDVIAAETDIAFQQAMVGQKIDVSVVEAAEIGKLADKPVAEQVRAARAQDVIPKEAVADETGGYRGTVYHQTDGNFTQFDTSKGADSTVWFSSKPESFVDEASAAQAASGNSRVVSAEVELKKVAGWDEVDKYSIDELIQKGYDGAILDGDVQVFEPSRIKVIDNIDKNSFNERIKQQLSKHSQELDTSNTETISRHNAATLDYRNDALIDYDAIEAADIERSAIMDVEGRAEAEAYLKDAEAEIQQMLDQDILNEADLAEYQQAIQDLNEAQTIDALNIAKLCLTRG